MVIKFDIILSFLFQCFHSFKVKLDADQVMWKGRNWLSFNSFSFGEMLAFTLTAFLELMDHGIVSWDLISLSFIKQVPPPTKQYHTTHIRVSQRLHWTNLSSRSFSIPFYQWTLINHLIFRSSQMPGNEWVRLPSNSLHYMELLQWSVYVNRKLHCSLDGHSQNYWFGFLSQRESFQLQ